MDPGSNFTVESFFINVGVGDCAVHLLFRNSTVYKAVLVDGGDTFASQVTADSIAELRQRYGQFDFNAIVITHWDGDHFRGTLRMIFEDYVAKNGQSSYIVDGVTKFYAPATWWDKVKQGAKFALGKAGTGYELLIRPTLNQRIRLCEFVISTYCIGYDVFSGEQVVGFGGVISSLDEVYTVSQELQNKQPILLCIGCDTFFIGQSDRPEPAESWFKKPNPESLMNSSSIMLISVWPKAAATDPPRINLYTAGDCEEKEEIHFVDWIKNNNAKINVIKPGHHGSALATPEGMLRYKTDHFIISAGDSHGHPSFSLLFFIMALTFYNFHKDVRFGQRQPHIYATCYPYWLLKDKQLLHKKDCNLEHVLGYGEGCYIIAEELKTLTGIECVDQWFFKAFQPMKNTYRFAKTDDELLALDNVELRNRKSPLATAALIPRDQLKDKDDEWADALTHTLESLREKWEVVGNPVSPGINVLVSPSFLTPVSVIHVVADSAGVRIPQITQVDAGYQATDEQFTADEVEISIDFLDDDPDDDHKTLMVGRKKSTESNIAIKTITKQEINQKRGRHKKKAVDPDIVEPSALESSSSPTLWQTHAELAGLNPAIAEDWVHSLFVDDLQKVGNLPDTLREFPLSSSASTCCTWFGHLLQGTVVFKFDGTTRTQSVSLERIILEVTLSPKSQISAFTFSSDGETRENQFGADNVKPQSLLGFDSRMPGMVLALSKMSSISFSDFAKIFHFALDPWVSELLSDVQLVAPTTALGRNGIWIIPGRKLRLRLRLEIGLDRSMPSAAKLEQCLAQTFGGGLSITDLRVCGLATQETVCLTKSPQNRQILKTYSMLALSGTLKLSDGEPSFLSNRIYIRFAKDGFELTVKLLKDGKFLQDAIDWLAKILDGGNDGAIGRTLKGMIGDVDFYFHSIVLGYSAKLGKLSRCQINLELSLNYGIGGLDVPLIATFTWTPGAYVLRGEIFDPTVYGALPYELNPLRERTREMEPYTKPAASAISIRRLLGLDDSVAFPSGIPDEITGAALMLTYQNGRVGLCVEGSLQCSAPPESSNDSAVPHIWFDELHLFISARYGTNKGVPSDFTLRFRGNVVIESAPREDEVRSETSLDTTIEYVKDGTGSSWKVSADIWDLHIADLYEFFAEDANDAIMDVMSQIHIAHIGIEFEYKTKAPSRFALHGALNLGPVVLDLNYVHEDKGWNFKGILSQSTTQLSPERNPELGSILKSLLDDADIIPDFVSNLVVPLDTMKLELGCSQGIVQAKKYVVFYLNFKIGDLMATFAQVRSCAEASQSTTTASQRGPARLLRLSLSKLPTIDGIPVVNSIQQPFDELGIVWVNRQIGADELAVLNHIAFPKLPILAQEVPGKAADGDVAQETKDASLAAGCHFQVFSHEQDSPKLVLDYVAGRRSQNTVVQSVGEEKTLVVEGEDHAVAGSDPSNTAMAPMAKSVGPLTLRNIGLRVEDLHTLTIVLDAAVRLGTITFELQGFALAFDLSEVKDFKNLSSIRPQVSISGMAVNLEKAPTRLAGMFTKFVTTDELNRTVFGYRGAISISLTKWSAVAAGVYEEHADFKSFFVFGMLKGVIAQFACAEINGVTGGYGYNSKLTMPDPADVHTHPFVALNTGRLIAKPDILAQLTDLAGGSGTQHIQALKDSQWFVAGLTMKAFQLVDVTALFALDLSVEPKISILMTASATFPKQVAADRIFVALDFAMVATVDPTHGTILADGQLTPRSFILDSSCRLTGGFALAYFTSGNEHDGDFCFTVGGYHPRYQPPAHYPMAPARVGIAWQYNNEIRIVGEAYFAITTTCAMGGGRLELAVDKGWLRAGFQVWAHFFLQFHPFWFDLDVGFIFFVEVRLGRGIFSIHLGPSEFSASLNLYGPPMAGRATIRMWVYNATICFGAPPRLPAALTLVEFLRMVKNQKSDDTTAKPDFTITIASGIVVGENSEGRAIDPNIPVDVRSVSLQLMVETRVPVRTAFINERGAKIRSVEKENEETEVQIYAAPMRLRSPMATSELKISFRRDNSDLLLSEEEVRLIEKPIIKHMPPALWGQYRDDPADQANAPSIPHVMGYAVSIGRAEPSQEGLPPFDNVTFNSVDVLPGDERPIIHPPEKEHRTDAAGAAAQDKEAAADKARVQVAMRERVLRRLTSFKAKHSKGGMAWRLSTTNLD